MRRLVSLGQPPSSMSSMGIVICAEYSMFRCLGRGILIVAIFS